MAGFLFGFESLSAIGLAKRKKILIEQTSSRGDWGWSMHFLVFLIYLVSGKAHFDNYRV